MKKLSVLMLPFIFIMFDSSVNTELRYSHHDFSRAEWSGREFCKPCHTPHNANTEVANSPLWNHTLSTASYTLYSSLTMNASSSQPSSKSKLCLSCHDGTVAIDAYGGKTSGSRFMGNTYKMGTDLSNDHPISIAYNSALATTDSGLYDPSTTDSGLGDTIAKDLLDNGKVECTSCHDAHISRNTQGCSGCHSMHGKVKTVSLSLWKSNTNSALCLTCHKK